MPSRDNADTSYEDDAEFVIAEEDATSNTTNTKKRKATAQPSGKKTSKRRKCTRWTQEENERLRAAFEKYGGKQWKKIAEEVGGKNEDQCNQHWYRVLDPRISKKKWSDEEDQLLLSTVNKFGSSAWKKISNALPGRTDLQCRHRWTRLIKKQEEDDVGETATKRISKRSSKKSTSPEDSASYPQETYQHSDHVAQGRHSEECNSLDSPQFAAQSHSHSHVHPHHHMMQSAQHHPLPPLTGINTQPYQHNMYEAPNSAASTYLDSGSAHRFPSHHQYGPPHPGPGHYHHQHYTGAVPHYAHPHHGGFHHYYPTDGGHQTFATSNELGFTEHHRTLPMLQDAIGAHHFDTGHSHPTGLSAYGSSGEHFHSSFGGAEEQEFSFLQQSAHHPHHQQHYSPQDTVPLSSLKFSHAPSLTSSSQLGSTKTEGMLLNHDFSDLIGKVPQKSAPEQ